MKASSFDGTFEQIVLLDETGLQDWALDELATLTRKPLRSCAGVPVSDSDAVARIGGADCVFVSWHTRLTAATLRRVPNLRYIGMCCSLYDAESANVDIGVAAELGIVVKGVRDYGDEGLVEYVLSELIRLLKGLGEHQWRAEPVELAGRAVGIVGMGATGSMLAHRLQAFGADVCYFNRSRKPNVEAQGIRYAPLAELLEKIEVLSLHLPRGAVALGPREFEQLGSGKILINTSLGLVFERAAFECWLEDRSNFAILDGDGVGAFADQVRRHRNVIATPVVSGWTHEARGRLSRKVIDNAREFLSL